MARDLVDRSARFGRRLALPSPAVFLRWAAVPVARGGVGAVATQALVNPLYAARRLDAMAARGRSGVALSDTLVGRPGATAAVT